MHRIAVAPRSHAISDRITPHATVIPVVSQRVPGPRYDSSIVEELGSEHLVTYTDLAEASISRLIAEELRGKLIAPNLGATARTDRPPRPTPTRGWRAPIVVGAVTFGVAFCIAIGGYFLYERQAEKAQAARRAVPVAPAVRAPVTPASLCAVNGGQHVIARRALVRGGVETASLGRRVGLGVVTGNKEGAAFELDPSSMAVTSTVKVIAPDLLRRVLPAFNADTPLDALIDSGPARMVSDGDGDTAAIGLRNGFLTWTPHEGQTETRLWSIGAGPDVEAPRVVGTSNERVVTFRRKAEIWIGGLRFDGEPHTVGSLVKVTEPAAQVGIPTVARGDTGWIVAWAQRDTASAPWAVRWRRFKDFSTSGPVRSLPMPPGGPGSRAIAPSIAPLHAGRFLLAWTEGVARHQVRAQVIGANDLPVEAPLAISQPDVDAGQGQIALDTEGRGAVAFLVSKGHAFELAITPLDCEAGLHHP